MKNYSVKFTNVFRTGVYILTTICFGVILFWPQAADAAPVTYFYIRNATDNTGWVESRSISGNYQIDYGDDIEFRWTSSGADNCNGGIPGMWGSTSGTKTDISEGSINTGAYSAEYKTYSMMCYKTGANSASHRVYIPVFQYRPFQVDFYWGLYDNPNTSYPHFPQLHNGHWLYPENVWSGADGVIDHDERIQFSWFGRRTLNCSLSYADSPSSPRTVVGDVGWGITFGGHPSAGRYMDDSGSNLNNLALYEPAPGTSRYYEVTCIHHTNGSTTSDSFTLTRLAPPVPTCTVNLSPNPINEGQGSTLEWNSSNADTFYIQNVGYVNAAGTGTVSPSQTTSYTGTVTNSYGSADCTGTQTLTVYQSCPFDGTTITHGSSTTAYQNDLVPYGSSCVSETRTCNNGTLSGSYQYASCAVNELPPPPTVSISVSPSVVHRGDTAVLTWSSENADSCTVTGGGDSWTGISSPPEGQETSPVRGEVTYVLECENAADTVSASATVRVVPSFQET